MTNELIIALTDIKVLIDDWSSKTIPTEEEFIEKLKKTTARVVLELGNQKEEEIQV